MSDNNSSLVPVTDEQEIARMRAWVNEHPEVVRKLHGFCANVAFNLPEDERIDDLLTEYLIMRTDPAFNDWDENFGYGYWKRNNVPPVESDNGWLCGLSTITNLMERGEQIPPDVWEAVQHTMQNSKSELESNAPFGGLGGMAGLEELGAILGGGSGRRPSLSDLLGLGSRRERPSFLEMLTGGRFGRRPERPSLESTLRNLFALSGGAPVMIEIVIMGRRPAQGAHDESAGEGEDGLGGMPDWMMNMQDDGTDGGSGLGTQRADDEEPLDDADFFNEFPVEGGEEVPAADTADAASSSLDDDGSHS